jgi:hypothetical protein
MIREGESLSDARVHLQVDRAIRTDNAVSREQWSFFAVVLGCETRTFRLDRPSSGRHDSKRRERPFLASSRLLMTAAQALKSLLAVEYLLGRDHVHRAFGAARPVRVLGHGR